MLYCAECLLAACVFPIEYYKIIKLPKFMLYGLLYVPSPLKLLSLTPTPPALIRAEKRLGENFNFLSFFLYFSFNYFYGRKLREREKKAFVLLSCAYKSFMNDCWILSSSQLLCQLILRCLSECFRWENCFSPLYFSFNYSSMGWV